MFNASFLLCFGSLFKARNTNYRHIARPKQKKNRPTSNAKQQHKVKPNFLYCKTIWDFIISQNKHSATKVYSNGDHNQKATARTTKR
ncbi:hypothetical protein EJ73_02370 [Hoylesella shahii DSM 15611 = JCM 12083]|uniref:Uncharacterized protein n=1 Tax=Hoylesella shahii DSM 15611 = JCM 12083 TaxID=1122991 RepID=A0A318HQ83_9BACT|nr:hypothetical protein EJ73_02370 [Hoylesella shahii DSM 15611 = JCM 12083]